MTVVCAGSLRECFQSAVGGVDVGECGCERAAGADAEFGVVLVRWFSTVLWVTNKAWAICRLDQVRWQQLPAALGWLLRA